MRSLWKSGGARWVRNLCRDNHAQDIIEYALMASVVAVACGAILPPVSNSVSVIFSKITSLMALV